MAKEYFKHYVWLLQTLPTRGYCTFEELNDIWMRSSFNPDGRPMSKRTLSNHKASILDMFGIRIDCDRRTNEYYIKNEGEVDDGSLQEWMLSALSLGSMLNDDASLKGKVIFDNVPSSQKYLPVFIEGIKRSVMVGFTYQSPEMPQPREFLLEPYCVRLFRKRWYVLGRREGAEEPRLYSLDRMLSASCTEMEYSYPKDFSAEEYYSSYFGIDIPRDACPDRIRIKASERQGKNLRSLPLHHSQIEVGTTDDGHVLFEYFLVPSSTFIGEIMQMQGSVEVLEPASLRARIHRLAETLAFIHG